LLAAAVDGVRRFRLVGVAADHLSDSRTADPPSLFERQLDSPRRLEQAIDAIRGKLGEGSVRLGRTLQGSKNGS
jgi:DNA polymerase IV